MWTLTLAPGMWITTAIIILIAGKVLQQGGRAYGEGKPWVLETAVGTICQIGALVCMALMLIAQNAQ